jgi:hypothetical protein
MHIFVHIKLFSGLITWYSSFSGYIYSTVLDVRFSQLQNLLRASAGISLDSLNSLTLRMETLHSSETSG